MAEVSIKKLKDYLMDKIDTTDMVEVDKVNRYCSLTSMKRKLSTEVNKDGVTVVTVNATQEFVKAHPAIEKIVSINTQLLSIEKTFRFTMPDSLSSGSNGPLDDEELV